jgi:hypothetical protein
VAAMSLECSILFVRSDKVPDQEMGVPAVAAE